MSHYKQETAVHGYVQERVTLPCWYVPVQCIRTAHLCIRQPPSFCPVLCSSHSMYVLLADAAIDRQHVYGRAVGGF